LIYFITYLDRVVISVGAPMLSKDFGIGKAELGAVFSAFNLAYFLFQVPNGMIGDKYGPRLVLGGLVLMWSVMTAATALAWSFAALLVIRFLFGAGEAGAFASATRAFSFWIPATERGFAQGLTHGFSRFGGAVTPIIIAPLAVAYGWQISFYLCAIAGLIWAVLWLYWYRDTPVEYQKRWGANTINQAEIDIIDKGKVSKKAADKIPLKTMLKSRSMWALGVSYAGYCYCMWIYLTWLPTYLVEARGFTIINMGIFASLPLLAGTFGDTLGGWLSDIIWQRTGSGRFARRVVAMVGLLVAAAFMIPGAQTDSPYLAVFFLACALFGLEMSVGVFWAVCLDIGQECAGTVSGLMQGVGQAGSFLSPLLFGIIVQQTGSWVYPFLIASAFLAVAALLWLWIDPEKPVTQEIYPEKPAASAVHA
jgi:sugar phosphate permease